MTAIARMQPVLVVQWVMSAVTALSLVLALSFSLSLSLSLSAPSCTKPALCRRVSRASSGSSLADRRASAGNAGDVQQRRVNPTWETHLFIFIFKQYTRTSWSLYTSFSLSSVLTENYFLVLNLWGWILYRWERRVQFYLLEFLWGKYERNNLLFSLRTS